MAVYWQLRYTAITMTNEVYCGYEEHTHDETCYDEDGNLICALTQHTHTVDCLVNLEADVETAADWEATLPALTGNLRTDIVNIAYSQVGYTESSANFTLADDGTTHMGYTRYGAWYGGSYYGSEYADWDSLFAAFCLNYAGIDGDFPFNSGAYAWSAELAALGCYKTADAYSPSIGDIAFLDTDADGRANVTAIVVSTGDALKVIQGNYSDSVALVEYSASDAAILGYANVTCTGEEELAETEAEEAAAEEAAEDAESVRFTASDGGVTVSVTAPEGALPDNAVLSVSLIDEDSDAYAAAAEAIGYEEDTGIAAVSEDDDGEAETEETVLSLAVLDISFTADGAEVEPAEAVTVTIDASSLLTEDADASTLAVQHLEETSEGVTPVLVADATGSTEGTVDTENAVVAFTTESFSSFTLSWYTHTAGFPWQTSYGATICVNIYADGDLASGDALNYSLSTGTSTTLTINISDLIDVVTGMDAYEYSYATITYNSTTYGSSANSVVSVSSIYSESTSGRWPTTTTYSYSSTITYDSGSGTGPNASTTNGNANVSYFTINLYYTTAATYDLTVSKVYTDSDGNTITVDDSVEATFTLTRTDTTTGATQTVQIAGAGVGTFNVVSNGTYTLSETDVPDGYYTPEDIDITIVGGEVTGYSNNIVTVTNKELPTLTVSKIYVNADGTAITDEDLTGLEASFTLTASDGTTYTGTTTGDGGTWEVGKLGDGTYTLTETATPEGYEASEAITITIEDGKIYADGTEVSTVTVTNKKLITLTVVKTYVSSNGNTIDVSSDDAAVATFTLASTGTTDAYSESVTITGAGEATFTGLAYNGTYTLSESMSSTYYTTAAAVTITVVNGAVYVGDAETDTVTMTNTDANHLLAGMSYAIAALNSTYQYALQASASTYSGGGLAGTAVTEVGETGDGITIIYGEDVTIWTFEAVAGEANAYYIYTTVGDTTYYLNITSGSTSASGISVSTTPQAITVTEGTGTYAGQYRLSVGNTAVNWYGNSYSAYGATFGAYNDGLNHANEMLTLCEVVSTSGSLLLYDLNTDSLSLDTASGSGWYISSYTDDSEETMTWTATSGTSDDLTSTATIQMVETGDSLNAILGKGVNGYYTYVTGRRLDIAAQMIADGKSPGKEFRFDYWVATDVNGDTCQFAEEAEIYQVDDDGYIYIYDIDGVLRQLASGTTLTAHWTEISDIVMFFVNYSGTVLDVEGDVTGRNQQEFTGIVAIGHVYFGTETVGSDSTFAADADAGIRDLFAYSPSYTVTEIVIDYVTVYENGVTSIFYPAEGINDSLLDEYLLAYIRDSGITIKISTADGNNPAIENENATTDNYTVRWYVLKEQVDGWHIDGVMVAKTSEMTVTKTFSGLTETQVNTILDSFNMPLLLGGQTYVTMYPADPEDNGNATANGVYDYNGKESGILSYQWTVHTITNETYTLSEADYALSGYDVATLAVHYYIDDDGNEVYVSGSTDTSADLSVAILGGTSTGFSFNNLYTESGTGMLAIIKTDGNGLNLSGATFTLTDENGDEVATATSNVNGLVFFNNLAAGTYYLEETDAPSGYQEITTTWKVVVDDSSGITVTVYASTDGGTTYDDGTLCYSSSDSSISSYEIENETENTTVTITKTFGGELTYAQLQELYEASTSDNDYGTAGSTYTRLPYYIELEDSNGNTQKLYLQDATRAQSGFSFTWTLSGIDPGTWTITEYNYIYDAYIDTAVVATVNGDDKTVTVTGSDVYRYASFTATFIDSESDAVLISNSYTNYFTLSLSKVDSETGEPLSGAEFKIYGAYSEATDVNDQITYEDDSGATQTLYYIGTITSDENGLATISGLQLSDDTKTFAYVLNESSAPSGYVLSTDVTVITVTIDSENYYMGVYSVTVENSKPSTTLPEAGGAGLTAPYVMGGGMTLTAATCLLKRRRKED